MCGKENLKMSKIFFCGASHFIISLCNIYYSSLIKNNIYLQGNTATQRFKASASTMLRDVKQGVENDN